MLPQQGCAPRLDGTRGKKQVWRSLGEKMYCSEESTCDIYWDFSAPRTFRPLAPAQYAPGPSRVARVSDLWAMMAFVVILTSY